MLPRSVRVATTTKKQENPFLNASTPTPAPYIPPPSLSLVNIAPAPEAPPDLKLNFPGAHGPPKKKPFVATPITPSYVIPTAPPAPTPSVPAESSLGSLSSMYSGARVTSYLPESSDDAIEPVTRKPKLSLKESEEPEAPAEPVSDVLGLPGSDDVVQFSRLQRFPLPGEPDCVMCGRFGAYICDETEQDVCSLECKTQHLRDYQASQTGEYNDDEPLVRSERVLHYVEHPSISGLTDQQVNDIRREVQIAVKGDNIPRPVLEFSNCNFPEKLLENIQTTGYDTPTPVQLQAIPIALAGRDLMACASTGSGKTASFVLPALSHILAFSTDIKTGKVRPSNRPLVLILAPTRELCMQIEDQIKPLAYGLPVRTALVVGGLPMPNQVYRLRKSVQIIVATPGRLLDIITKHTELECLGNVSLLVLDEVDMMLHMGFEMQVTQIVEHLGEHQTLLFSATIPPAIEKMGASILHKPAFVAVGSPSTPTAAVKQTVLWAENKVKRKKLFDLLKDEKYYHPPLVVFVDSKQGSDMLANSITKQTGISAVSIHGDKTQTERTNILKSFIDGEHPIIVSTAVLGRGLDLLRVDMVVNFDMPPTIQEYIHQIGRAGRLGRPGWAVTFINNDNKAVFVELADMLQGLRVKIPSELLNSPYFKASAAGQSTGNKRKSGAVKDPVALDAWRKELNNRQNRR